MKIKQLFALFCFSLFALSGFAQTKEAKRVEFEWEKVVPLVTKKAEVENYFDKPYFENGNVSTFKFNLGRILIWYIGAEDSEKTNCKWNVSPDTVQGFSISLPEPIPISSLKYDLSKFEKTPNDDGRLIYTNLKRGVSFATEETKDGEEVVVIRYEPSYADVKNKCVKK